MTLGHIRGALVLAAFACGVPAVLPGAAEEPVRERREETVARCMRDVRSPDVAVRRRASLLLGKYPSPQTDRVLVECLQDADAGIRLGALVSLTEERMLPAVARMGVFRLLKDPDIHVRRQASSLLGDALGVSLRGGINIQGNVRIRTGRMPQPGSSEWHEMRELMLHGLGDEDGSVRKNVLMVCGIFDVKVPADRLAAFLADGDGEVRLKALSLLSRTVRNMDELRALVLPLAKDPAAAVRATVCRMGVLFGQAGEGMMRQFLKDPAGEVRVCAAIGLRQLRVADSVSVLRGVLFDESIPGSERRSLVYEVGQFPRGEALATYRDLLEGDSSDLAEQAMGMLCRPQSGIDSAGFFIPYLDSGKGRIGSMALSGIRMRMKKLSAKDLIAMLGTGNSEAHGFVLRQGVLMLKNQERGEVLAEACMSEDAEVRRRALQQLGRYRPEGWEELLMASLEDSDPTICLAAADGLCRRPSKASQQALKTYLPSCKDQTMRRRIEAALNRRAFR